MSSGFERVGERLVHQGHVWHVVVAEFTSPDGETFHRDVVRSPGAVAVAPVYQDDAGQWRVVMVEQYRPALERPLLEIPAGMRDVEGEAPELTARRELVEEAGFEAGRIEHLITYTSSAGMTDATCVVFAAYDLTPVPRDVHGPEERHMTVIDMPLADAVGMVARGEIDDAKTVIALLLVERGLRGA